MMKPFSAHRLALFSLIIAITPICRAKDVPLNNLPGIALSVAITSSSGSSSSVVNVGFAYGTYQFFVTETGTLTDLDTWVNLVGQNVQKPDTTTYLTPHITSGTPISDNYAYDFAAGKTTRTITVQTKINTQSPTLNQGHSVDPYINKYVDGWDLGDQEQEGSFRVLFDKQEGIRVAVWVYPIVKTPAGGGGGAN